MLTRRRLILAGIALLALVGSFGAGRYSRPAKVIDNAETRATVDTATSDKLAIATAEVLSLKRDLATWQARAASAEAHTDVVTKWRYLPGKVVEVTREEKSDTHSEEHSQGGTHEATDGQKQARTQANQERASEAHGTTVTLHTHEVIDERPRLLLMALPGAQRDDHPVLGLPGHVVVGAAAAYRIAGPVVVGGWGSTDGGGSGGAVLGLLF